MRMYDIQFERCFIEKVLELVSQQKIFVTKISFAKAIWPEMTERSANTTLNDVINLNSKGKKRNLRLHEAVRMAQLVEKPFPSLCFEVAETLKVREKYGDVHDSKENLVSQSKKNQDPVPQEIGHMESTDAARPESGQ